MTRLIRLGALALMLSGLSAAWAGSIYQVTSKKGDKTVTYEVRFGGGRLMEEMTAFDPQTKKFVYLQWERDGKRPAPVSRYWDHHTGETIPLYRFPNAKNPLPAIPSAEAMKACPVTGDKNFKLKLTAMYD